MLVSKFDRIYRRIIHPEHNAKSRKRRIYITKEERNKMLTFKGQNVQMDFPPHLTQYVLTSENELQIVHVHHIHTA